MASSVGFFLIDQKTLVDLTCTKLQRNKLMNIKLFTINQAQSLELRSEISKMDLFQSPISLLFALFLFLYIILNYPKTSKFQYPPGPRKFPMIGNLLDLAGSLPHRSLKDLAKKYGPLMHLQLGEISALIISSPKTAEEIMKNHDLNFLDRPEILAAKIMSYDCAGIVFAPYGDYWRQIRKICMLELLSSKRVQSYRSLREEEVNNFINSITSSSGLTINLSEKIFALTNSITSKLTFGKKCNDQEFIAAVQETSSLAGGFDVPDLFPSLKFLHRFSRVKGALEKLHIRVDNFFTNIIDDHRVKCKNETTSVVECGEEDLVDVLLKLQQSSDLEYPITTENIKAVILDIFTAGTETSSTTLEWAMSELIKNPHKMEKAQAEVRHILKGKSNIGETDIQNMNYLKLIIKETLRLHPPVPLLLPREAKETCEINGYDIPKKTKVIVNAWAIGRDEKYWPNAESFEPERFEGSPIDFKGTSFEYIPFGAGRRMCPGISFGNANMELPLAQLLYKFDWKLPNGMKAEEFDMTEAFGATVRRKNDLLLIATPYAS